MSGEKTGFAYADQISLLALEQSAQAARTIVREEGDGKVKTTGAIEHQSLYTSIDPLQSMSREEKLDILRRVDNVARAADKRVQEVSASLTGVYELILVAATDGTLAADVRPLVRLSVSVRGLKMMASASVVPAAAAVVLVMTGSCKKSMATYAQMHRPKKPFVWR